MVLLSDCEGGSLLFSQLADPFLPICLCFSLLLQTDDFALKTSTTPPIFADRILRVQREDHILRLIIVFGIRFVFARRNERSQTFWNLDDVVKRTGIASANKPTDSISRRWHNDVHFEPDWLGSRRKRGRGGRRRRWRSSSRRSLRAGEMLTKLRLHAPKIRELGDH